MGNPQVKCGESNKKAWVNTSIEQKDPSANANKRRAKRYARRLGQRQTRQMGKLLILTRSVKSVPAMLQTNATVGKFSALARSPSDRWAATRSTTTMGNGQRQTHHRQQFRSVLQPAVIALEMAAATCQTEPTEAGGTNGGGHQQLANDTARSKRQLVSCSGNGAACLAATAGGGFWRACKPPKQGPH